jgi:hypothetical protein
MEVSGQLKAPAALPPLPTGRMTAQSCDEYKNPCQYSKAGRPVRDVIMTLPELPRQHVTAYDKKFAIRFATNFLQNLKRTNVLQSELSSVMKPHSIYREMLIGIT